VWDWERGVKTNHFANGNPAGTKITEIKFLNEDDVALLMTGSGDGVVRIYRGYENDGEAELVSSWRALTDLLPSRRSSGLVAEWQQGRGTMLVGGDVKVIRVWDAPREMCLSVSVPHVALRHSQQTMLTALYRTYPRAQDLVSQA
jgi:regulator-associated protein of mTOR